MIQKIEELTKAAQGLQMVVSDLRQALKTANSVESLAILKAIGDAAELHRTVDQLRAAVEAQQQATEAAPEILAALKTVVESFKPSQMWGGKWVYPKHIEDARAVVQKFDGVI